jgi:hypothetical protein
MRNRARVIAAAVVTAALAAGSTGAAVASSAGAKPGGHAKTMPASGKRATDSDLAARLGVPPGRLDQALRTVKISLSKVSAKPAEGQFDAELARILGIPEARVRQAFPAGKPGGSKAAGSKGGVRTVNDALTAVVARVLHVSTARVNAALRPLFVAGTADSSSPVLAAAARSLGVSTQQLSAALAYAKQSLAGGK